MNKRGNMTDRTIEEQIDEIEDQLIPILADSGFGKIPIVTKVAALADTGEPQDGLQRLKALLAYLNDRDNKITAKEFREKTIGLLQEMP